MNPDMEEMPQPNAEWLDGFRRDAEGKLIVAADGIVPPGVRQTVYWRKDGSAAAYNGPMYQGIPLIYNETMEG